MTRKPSPAAPSPYPPVAAFGNSPRARLGTISFVVALLSIACPPLGIVAMLLGAIVRRRERQLGTTRAGALATSAMALGATTCVVTAALIAWLIQRPSAVHTIAGTGAQRVSAPRGTRVEEPAELLQPSAFSSQPRLQTQMIGRLMLVDVGPTIRSLSDTVGDQYVQARGHGQRLVLWTVALDCAPCTRVTEALVDDRVQRALAGVRLLRIDAHQFAVELSHLNVPTDVLPGFALVGDDARTRDFVHGGEWDEDVPQNIAPVLESFVHGTYMHRRDPWRGGPRSDETAL